MHDTKFFLSLPHEDNDTIHQIKATNKKISHCITPTTGNKATGFVFKQTMLHLQGTWQKMHLDFLSELIK